MTIPNLKSLNAPKIGIHIFIESIDYGTQILWHLRDRQPMKVVEVEPHPPCNRNLHSGRGRVDLARGRFPSVLYQSPVQESRLYR